MGVPKFFRYISERYPCLSETVREYQIPEFDNLYLDMNGIIHMCSHPDDGDAHFRITEERIFVDIFHYIEVLFRMIKPRKLFFMAVDGVAPRAKMNQQRGRRFRSAKEAVVLEAKAIERGETLPSEARFDSNCITPGTVFMARLQDQLKYFVVHKISSDKLWKNCKIILSGHETPGEGEHKIMDYIRYMRSQAGYDPNTRHCLYGLDADLIMLGLCTHEPHFSLLREEVRFGKKSNKRKNIPEQITFFLLHLSLMREYLELEFLPLKTSLKFEYNMESIIDDWVLMGFLVGNDFIPNLPNMHIDNGALPILYRAYMKVLPQLDGYINEGGILNLERFEIFIKELSSIDMQNFTEKYADLKWFEAKTGRQFSEKKTELNSDKVKEHDDTLGKTSNSDLANLIKATDDMLLEPSQKDPEGDDSETEIESTDYSSDDNLIQAEFIQHKTDYYMNKLRYKDVTQEVLRSQAEEYVRAIQWNLHYYYNGVCSWSWYYPHHYAPYISDIKDFLKFTFGFELGQPFKPYEQLLAVLPAASKILLPEPYQKLMTDENSPIKMYYPEDFETDLNGKRQEWEAVVLIPFIEEDVLLKAMDPCNKQLTAEETARNTHSPMLVYQYTSACMNEYVAPKYFPNISEPHAKCFNIFIEDIRVPRDKLVKGAYPGAKFDVYYPGFPTMKHLDYVGSLKKAKVRVFEQPSRGENMILQIIEDDDVPTPDAIAKDLLGKTVHVGWPHLIEAMVVSVSCDKYRYNSTGQVGQYNVEEVKGGSESLWDTERQAITEHYMNRLGVDVGQTEVLVHVQTMTGRKYMFSQEGRVTLEKQWADIQSSYPLQTVVTNLTVHEENYVFYKNIEDVHPIGSHCFMLGQPCYGVMGEVLDSKETLKNGRIKISIKKQEEPDLTSVIQLDGDISVRFINIHVAASKLAISKKLFGRITGSVFLVPRKLQQMEFDDVPKSNIGLNLKFNKKNEEVPGYTRKEGNTWYYSQKAVNLVSSYMDRFPVVFEYLNYHVGNDVYEENKMFPDGDAKEQIRCINAWIKEQPYYSIERQSCGSYVMDPEAIQLLEKVVDEFNANTSKMKQVVMQVKPHLLYKNSLQFGNLMPDPATTFKLYDRVINVREGYTVPLGFKGTIVGVHNSIIQNEESETTFDVLFDQAFAGALSINTSSNRGYRMSKPALICISHGIRALEQKSGKPGQYQNIQNKISPNNNSNNYNNIGSQPNMLGGYPNNRFPPPNPMFPNWPQGCNFPIQPPIATSQNFNPFNYNQRPSGIGPFNYPCPPFGGNTGNYNQPAPHSFVPYKNNHFPMDPAVTSPHYIPNNRPQAVESRNNERTDVNGKAPYRDHFIPMQTITPSANNNKFPVANENSGNFSTTPRKEIKNSVSDTTSVLTAEDIFAHARAKDQLPITQKQTIENPKPDNVAKDFYHTVNLLIEFQTRDLGCPSYQYFKLNGDDTFIASIMMPNGSNIIGEPATSKDQAAEHAAIKALACLTKDEKKNTTVPVTSAEPIPPRPPRQWHNTLSNNQTIPQNNWSKPSQENWRCEKQENWRVPGTQPAPGRMKVNPMLIHKYLQLGNSGETERKKGNTSTTSSSSFVPLQAVRQQRSRTNSTNTSDTTLREIKNPSCPTSIKQEESVQVERSTDNITSNANTKPKRERKMRIAANFQLAMIPK